MPTPKQILEAVLFASDVPVGLAVLAEVLGDRSSQDVRLILTELGQEYDRGDRGVVLQEIAGGYQILSRKECSAWVERMLRSRRKIRLSKPALEALAIVAYRQPITKVEIDSIRGVDSAGVLHTLLERTLVTIKGRSKGVGRPLLYSSTPEFLAYMGLNDLSDLPELKELGPVLEERERGLERGIDDASEALPTSGGQVTATESEGEAEAAAETEADSVEAHAEAEATTADGAA